MSFVLTFTEPNDYPLHKGLSVLTGQRIGRDFIILRKLLDQYEDLMKSSVIGPDIGGPGGKLSADIISGFVVLLSYYVVGSMGSL